MEVLHFLFGVFGNATALFLFLSPTITFKRIIKSNSTEQFSGVPYGGPRPTSHQRWIRHCSSLHGMVFPLCPKTTSWSQQSMGQEQQLSPSMKLFCGLAATIFSIIMYASPLSIMRLVIKTKSVEFMPFFLSLFVFLCGTSWFVYGLLGRDAFIAVPNGFGCGLGTMQLILYFIYRNNKGSTSPEMKKANGNGTIEINGAEKQGNGKVPQDEQV
ncbi:hypothetical protein like AT1G21460 [Hibiscus trionum]|uniref:Bidirectional sugar transporter SWEET n=1 Tax=Hibiscus trionum TaxID=183268 RepID=A0A9W7I8K5_HIBTR|nr:hypothetical protein like AT1G21460 [Hibiscus trionum]